MNGRVVFDNRPGISYDIYERQILLKIIIIL